MMIRIKAESMSKAGGTELRDGRGGELRGKTCKRTTWWTRSGLEFCGHTELKGAELKWRINDQNSRLSIAMEALWSEATQNDVEDDIFVYGNDHLHRQHSREWNYEVQRKTIKQELETNSWTWNGNSRTCSAQPSQERIVNIEICFRSGVIGIVRYLRSIHLKTS